MNIQPMTESIANYLSNIAIANNLANNDKLEVFTKYDTYGMSHYQGIIKLVREISIGPDYDGIDVFSSDVIKIRVYPRQIRVKITQAELGNAAIELIKNIEPFLYARKLNYHKNEYYQIWNFTFTDNSLDQTLKLIKTIEPYIELGIR